MNILKINVLLIHKLVFCYKNKFINSGGELYFEPSIYENLTKNSYSLGTF